MFWLQLQSVIKHEDVVCGAWRTWACTAPQSILPHSSPCQQLHSGTSPRQLHPRPLYPWPCRSSYCCHAWDSPAYRSVWWHEFYSVPALHTHTEPFLKLEREVLHPANDYVVSSGGQMQSRLHLQSSRSLTRCKTLQPRLFQSFQTV